MSNCNCIKTVKSTAITDLGAFLVITIPPTSFRVREEFKLILCQTIPIADPLLDPQVIIFDGTNIFLTFNKLSEFVRRSNIKCRECYHAIVSNDPLHVQLRGLTDCCRCPNEALVPSVTAPVALTVAAVTAALTAAITPILPTGGAG